MRRVVVSDQARADLDELEDYIAQDSPRRARKFIADLSAKIETFATGGDLHGFHPIVGPPLRRVVFHKHIVFYEIRGEIVEVIAVLHGARDLLEALERRLGPR